MKQKLQILQHSMGLDQFGRGTKYRNRFVSGPGHHDQSSIDEMVRDGLMAVTNVSPGLLGEGGACYHVTRAGEAFIDANSPKPTKKTKSQERGARWREYGDRFDSFRDFLRWDTHPDREWNQP